MINASLGVIPQEGVRETLNLEVGKSKIEGSSVVNNQLKGSKEAMNRQFQEKAKDLFKVLLNADDYQRQMLQDYWNQIRFQRSLREAEPNEEINQVSYESFLLSCENLIKEDIVNQLALRYKDYATQRTKVDRCKAELLKIKKAKQALLHSNPQSNQSTKDDTIRIENSKLDIGIVQGNLPPLKAQEIIGTYGQNSLYYTITHNDSQQVYTSSRFSCSYKQGGSPERLKNRTLQDVNPTWNECFTFNLTGSPSESFVIEIFRHNSAEGDILLEHFDIKLREDPLFFDFLSDQANHYLTFYPAQTGTASPRKNIQISSTYRVLFRWRHAETEIKLATYQQRMNIIEEKLKEHETQMKESRLKYERIMLEDGESTRGIDQIMQEIWGIEPLAQGIDKMSPDDKIQKITPLKSAEPIQFASKLKNNPDCNKTKGSKLTARNSMYETMNIQFQTQQQPAKSSLQASFHSPRDFTKLLQTERKSMMPSKSASSLGFNSNPPQTPSSVFNKKRPSQPSVGGQRQRPNFLQTFQPSLTTSFGNDSGILQSKVKRNTMLNQVTSIKTQSKQLPQPVLSQNLTLQQQTHIQQPRFFNIPQPVLSEKNMPRILTKKKKKKKIQAQRLTMQQNLLEIDEQYIQELRNFENTQDEDAGMQDRCSNYELQDDEEIPFSLQVYEDSSSSSGDSDVECNEGNEIEEQSNNVSQDCDVESIRSEDLDDKPQVYYEEVNLKIEDPHESLNDKDVGQNVLDDAVNGDQVSPCSSGKKLSPKLNQLEIIEEESPKSEHIACEIEEIIKEMPQEKFKLELADQLSEVGGSRYDFNLGIEPVYVDQEQIILKAVKFEEQESSPLNISSEAKQDPQMSFHLNSIPALKESIDFVIESEEFIVAPEIVQLEQSVIIPKRQVPVVKLDIFSLTRELEEEQKNLEIMKQEKEIVIDLNDDELMRAESSPNNHHYTQPIAASNLVLFEKNREEVNNQNIRVFQLSPRFNDQNHLTEDSIEEEQEQDLISKEEDFKEDQEIAIEAANLEQFEVPLEVIQIVKHKRITVKSSPSGHFKRIEPVIIEPPKSQSITKEIEFIERRKDQPQIDVNDVVEQQHSNISLEEDDDKADFMFITDQMPEQAVYDALNHSNSQSPIDISVEEKPPADDIVVIEESREENSQQIRQLETCKEEDELDYEEQMLLDQSMKSKEEAKSFEHDNVINDFLSGDQIEKLNSMQDNFEEGDEEGFMQDVPYASSNDNHPSPRHLSEVCSQEDRKSLGSENEDEVLRKEILPPTMQNMKRMELKSQRRDTEGSLATSDILSYLKPFIHRSTTNQHHEYAQEERFNELDLTHQRNGFQSNHQVYRESDKYTSQPFFTGNNQIASRIFGKQFPLLHQGPMKQPGTKSTYQQQTTCNKQNEALQLSINSGHSGKSAHIGFLMKGLDGGAIFSKAALNKTPLNLSNAGSSINQQVRGIESDNGSKEGRRNAESAPTKIQKINNQNEANPSSFVDYYQTNKGGASQNLQPSSALNSNQRLGHMFLASSLQSPIMGGYWAAAQAAGLGAGVNFALNNLKQEKGSE